MAPGNDQKRIGNTGCIVVLDGTADSALAAISLLVERDTDNGTAARCDEQARTQAYQVTIAEQKERALAAFRERPCRDEPPEPLTLDAPPYPFITARNRRRLARKGHR